ncbi:hypothetical protein HQ529_00930, partial [Candidatus Woesearchaeota archaeon]|nr:hypothetical protein [Candidatus Woesearchaeota archaeon]
VVLIYFDIIGSFFLIGLLVFGFFLSAASLKHKIPVIYWFLERFERPEVLKVFPGKGVLFGVFGVLISLLLFEKDIALAAIMILALGDSFGALIGPFGNIKHPKPFSQKKFIEGSIVAFLAGFIGAMLFVNPLEAFIASFVAIFFEVLELKMLNDKIDDNIMIPLMAGAVITIMRVYF